MSKALDTLVYQWAVSEDEKKIPTVLEDIAELTPEIKITRLLEVFAHLVADVMESELDYIAAVNEYTLRAKEDKEVSQAGEDAVAEAIGEMPLVKGLEEASENATRALDIFQQSFVRALVSE